MHHKTRDEPSRTQDAASVQRAGWGLANDLAQQARRSGFWFYLAVLFTASVSWALSLVSGYVLSSATGDTLALVLAVVMHGLIAQAAHLYEVGRLKPSRAERGWGMGLLCAGVVMLAVLAIVRATSMVEKEASLVLAASLTVFLFTLETLVPAALGYVVAHAWMVWSHSRALARRLTAHAKQVAAATDPAWAWMRSENAVREEIASLRQDLATADPETHDQKTAEIRLLVKELRLLTRWNPGGGADESGTNGALRPEPVPPATSPGIREVAPSRPASLTMPFAKRPSPRWADEPIDALQEIAN